jgi:hypothetical protein
VGGPVAAALHYSLFWACFLVGFGLGMSDFDEGPTAWGALGDVIFSASQLLAVPIGTIAFHSPWRDTPPWQQHALLAANSLVWGTAAALILWVLEAAYLEKLSELAPSPEFLRLFRAVVLDAYQTRQADAQHQKVELDRRLVQLDKRKARLEEAYLYEQAIDRDTYARHSDRLSEERALLQLGRHGAEIEGLDVETLLNYAEYLALNPARLWQEAGPEQKARLQVFLVPSGLTWDGERFGTVESGLFFSRLARGSSSGGKMAPQVGFEPTTLRLTAGCSTAELLRNRR